MRILVANQPLIPNSALSIPFLFRAQSYGIVTCAFLRYRLSRALRTKAPRISQGKPRTRSMHKSERQAQADDGDLPRPRGGGPGPVPQGRLLQEEAPPRLGRRRGVIVGSRQADVRSETGLTSIRTSFSIHSFVLWARRRLECAGT